MSKTKLSIALGLLLYCSSVSANSQNLAESLMKLRADVERLDTAIVEEKESYRASIRSLMRQKDDLASVASREELQIKQTRQDLDKVRKEITEASKNSQGLKPLILTALETLSANVNASIPFKIKARIADLDKIKEQVQNDLVTPQKGLALTWNSYTDSIRITKENGLFKQTITLGGEDRLVEIARIGTMMLLFKTPDNEVGYAHKDAEAYSYVKVQNKEEKEQILSLFDAFKKQIRTGYFTLPNAILTMETN
ncbi:MAG: hypothetical protein AUK54_03290 [Helicobacteraceae bacterium CG2_30_36_10]|nr:MAG: hypothetical protein AUK54_03290 [Helicobacteraceae bacterium CG2_30_36_10]